VQNESYISFVHVCKKGKGERKTGTVVKSKEISEQESILAALQRRCVGAATKKKKRCFCRHLVARTEVGSEGTEQQARVSSLSLVRELPQETDTVT
jgi:hypothetical protein